MIKTWKERAGLENSEPFRRFIGVEWVMQDEINELRAALVEPQATQINAELLAALVALVNHKDDLMPSRLWDAARAAITRAEGGAA